MPTIPIRWADNTKDLQRNLKEGLNQIEATRAGAERMVKSLSGDKLTQAAHNFAAAVTQLGGVEKLTNAERERGNALLTKAIEKYNVLGQTAPQTLQDMAAATADNVKQATLFGTALGTIGGALTAGLILNLGRELFAAADALKKMSDQTGITVEGLQLLQAAGDDAGNSIDEITAAILQLENRLGGGDSGASGALKTLGLSFQDLQRLSPDQQFREIGAALAKVEDPAKQVALAIDLFGKSGAKVLPTLKANFEDISKGAFVMSAATVDAFDRIGDAAASAYRNTKAVGGTFLAAVYQYFEAPVIRAAREFENFQKMVAGIKRPAPVGGVTTAPALPGDAALAEITKDLNDQLRAKNALTKEGAEASRKAQEAKEREIGAAQRELEVIDRLEIVMPGLRQSVGELNSVELKNVEAWLAKIKAGEQLYDVLRKLEQIKAGDLDIGALPSGTVDNETIPRLKTHLDGIVTSTDKWLQGLSAVVPLLRIISTAGQQTFTSMGQRLTAALEGVIQLIQNFIKLTAAIKAANTAAEISQGLGLVLSAISIGLAFVAKGGVVTSHGVQRFAGGGFAQPALKVPGFARGTDSVPAMLTPGEMVLNAGQQARLFQIANGHTSPDREVGGSMNVVVNLNAPHAMNVDRHVLARWGRMLAPEIAKAISQNKDSSYTHFRAALGMSS